MSTRNVLLAGGLFGALFALWRSVANAATPANMDTQPLDSDDPRIPAAVHADDLARWQAAEILPARAASVDRVADKALANRARYEAVSAQTGVPWWFIAAVHNSESGARFDAHLHNGDPLTARTVHVPAGRPLTGEPPFTWEESAVDALTMQGLPTWGDWSVAGALYQLERYNGMGYRNRGIPSPYLWSGSDQYERGHFVADNVFDPNAVSRAVGGAALWKRLVERGELTVV